MFLKSVVFRAAPAVSAGPSVGTLHHGTPESHFVSCSPRHAGLQAGRPSACSEPTEKITDLEMGIVTLLGTQREATCAIKSVKRDSVIAQFLAEREVG